MSLTGHARRNRAFWDQQAPDWVGPGRRNWERAAPTWIPEAARLLRPGGLLVFVTNGTLLMLCTPEYGGAATERLEREYFGMHRFEWPDDGSVEFHLRYGEWVRLLRANGLEIEDLIEIQAPEGATTRFDYVTPEWGRRWPAEEIWKARKAA